MNNVNLLDKNGVVIIPDDMRNFDGVKFPKTMEKLVFHTNFYEFSSFPYEIHKSNLSEIVISGEHDYFFVVDGVLYERDDYGVNLLLYPPLKKDTRFVVPKFCTYFSTGAIGNNYLATIAFHNNFEGFDDMAFYHVSNVKSITIPSSVHSIGEYSFAIDNLANVLVNEGNEFYEAIDNVIYHKKERKMIFYPLGLVKKEFILPNHIVEIEDYMVHNQYLEKFTLNSEFNRVFGSANNVFSAWSNLQEFIVPENNSKLTAIDGVLYSKNLKILYSYPVGRQDVSFTLPKSVKKLAPACFQDTSLKTLILNDNRFSFRELQDAFLNQLNRIKVIKK